MTNHFVDAIHTVELAAWDFDSYEFRPELLDARKTNEARGRVLHRQPHLSSTAFCEEETQLVLHSIDRHRSRPDLHAEMLGLEWSLGVVDLRRLLAFQRRLSFNESLPALTVPAQDDWIGLVDIAFAPPRPVVYDLVHDEPSSTVTLQSTNPNVHLRVTGSPSAPLAVHAGSPFFEVAEYAGRWFLRDGYHRAYSLLRAGIFHLPAVIVQARTLAELGAVLPRFFSEAILLSDHPPFVSDFLDEALTIQYDRPQTIKTLRIIMEESIAPRHSSEHSGEQI
jgi:hypothetical protein